MASSAVYLAFDIGASSGPKLGLYSKDKILLSLYEPDNPVYDDTFEAFAASLVKCAEENLAAIGRKRSDVAGIGVATAGILDGSGAFQLFFNKPQYNGHNLPAALEEAFSAGVNIANDADAGALAEWAVLDIELLYWVFGGGWGGSWVNRSGEIRFPSIAWDGRDESLHPSNEPGYVIGLDRERLKELFAEVGASFEVFEKQFQTENIKGPCGSSHTIRAELILSGPGRYRLFQSILETSEDKTALLARFNTELSEETLRSGALISRLSSLRVEPAINTDRLYGKVLAEATASLLKRAQADGLPSGVPICLGGKPSYALPFFGPSTQRLLGKMGFHNYMRPSIIDERGGNANIEGAYMLARRAERGNRRSDA